MTESHSFTHHGRMFVIEADDWPSEEAASAAFIYLQTWAMQFGPVETAALHDALDKEREALVSEIAYARKCPAFACDPHRTAPGDPCRPGGASAA